MANRKLEERLEELRGFREIDAASSSATLDVAVSKALADRSNLIVAEGAKLAGLHRLVKLQEDLLGAYDRLFRDPPKSDPKCWGKTAILKALASLDYSESPPFLRGARHIQMEPVWGGLEDSAPQLRANATLALVSCTDIRRPEILRHLVDSLADPSETVRVEAVRALAQMNGDDAALVLRLKAHSGDPRPAVLGQVFDCLLQLEEAPGVRFVSTFLRAADEVRDEAALALGASRLPTAVQALLEVWKEARGEFASVLLRSLSSSRDEVALDFLLGLVREGTNRESTLALDALQIHQDSPEILARVEQAQHDREKRDQ